MIRHYSVFGGCLETEIDFPELRETDPCVPRWVFRTTGALEERTDLQEIGAQHIYGDVYARLFRHADGHRIAVDDTGRFEIDATGSSITWEEKAGAWPDFVRSHLLGRVLGTALFARGWMPLHASAVRLPSGIVAFLGPKRFGKSTLALALTRGGAKLVTDDTLPVELARPVRCWPGIHSIRVADDSLSAVGLARPDLTTREGKGIVTNIDPACLATTPAMLSAIYLLNPVEPAQAEAGDNGDIVSRERVPAVLSTIAIMGNFKLARMTGPGQSPEVMRRAAAIAENVPVFRLLVPRRLDDIARVAQRIATWHASPGSQMAAGGSAA